MNEKTLMIEYSNGTGRLTKISDNCNALRSNGVIGYFLKLPEVHSQFRIYADSLTPGGDVRIVSTSLVTSLEHEGGRFIFRTLNSAYMLEVFESSGGYL